MTMTIAGVEFEGPYKNTSSLKDEGGVYVVYSETNDSKWQRLDVGQSDKVKDRIESHDRKDCWEKNKQGDLGYCVRYVKDEKARTELEQKAREERKIPCGEK